MPKYEVRKRKWPESFPALKRPWELIRTSDGKPVSFYATPEEAQAVAKEAEKVERGRLVKGDDLLGKLQATGLVKRIGPTGTMRGHDVH